MKWPTAMASETDLDTSLKCLLSSLARDHHYMFCFSSPCQNLMEEEEKESLKSASLNGPQTEMVPV